MSKIYTDINDFERAQEEEYEEWDGFIKPY